MDIRVSIGYYACMPMTAAEFKRIRQAMGLTQAALAELLGVTRLTVARYETRTRRIPEMAARLLKRIHDETKKRGSD